MVSWVAVVGEAKQLVSRLDDPAHGLVHVKSVVSNALRLCDALPAADRNVVVVAAWWHDVGRRYGDKGHSKKSAEMAINA